MKRLLPFFLLAALPVAAQQYKMAVIGLVHSHVWGHLPTMLASEKVKLTGIAETNPELIAEAKKRGASAIPFFTDYKAMLDQTKPDFVWSFVENSRHLEIVEACASRKIDVIFEKPLAASYQDALAIRKLAHSSGIRVMTNYQMAWWPANYAAKAQADAGAVGQVWRLRGMANGPRPAPGNRKPGQTKETSMIRNANRNDIPTNANGANELTLTELEAIAAGKGSVATTVVDGVFHAAGAAVKMAGAVLLAF